MSDLTELGGVLHEEHFRILVWICDLKNRVSDDSGERAFDPGSEAERYQLRALISHLDQVVLHHAFEEDVLFPLIGGRGEDELTNFLTEDHAVIEPLTERLQVLAMNLLQHGCDRDRWRTFRAVAAELYTEMMSHLMIEEIIIVQRLDCFLDPETDQRLARQHTATRLLLADSVQTTWH